LTGALQLGHTLAGGVVNAAVEVDVVLPVVETLNGLTR